MLMSRALNPTAGGVEVRNSPIHGRGVFATKNINKGDVIEVAPVVKTVRDRDLTGESLLRKYDIKFDDVNHAIMLGYASIYNHADDNNAEWGFTSPDDLTITATKFIHKGAEIFVNYGGDFWDHRTDKI